MSRVCEHCGSDTYFAANFARVRDNAQLWRRRWEDQARELGLVKAQLAIARDDSEQERAGLQRKVHRQARVVRRLEDKLRTLKQKPHEGLRPDETEPVAQ